MQDSIRDLLEAIPDLIPSPEAMLFWTFVLVMGVVVAQLSSRLSAWISRNDEEEEEEIVDASDTDDEGDTSDDGRSPAAESSAEVSSPEEK
jgi:hypothetical protein